MKRYRLLSFPGAPQPASTSGLPQDPADEPLPPTAKQRSPSSPPPLKIMRQERDQGAPRPRGSATPDRKGQILTAESVVVVDPRSRRPASLETTWNEFYRVCFRCKNKIRDEKPVFMFGYLRAFCSIECREEQMIIEGVVLTK